MPLHLYCRNYWWAECFCNAASPQKINLLHRINWVGWPLYSLARHGSIIETFVKETCIRGYMYHITMSYKKQRSEMNWSVDEREAPHGSLAVAVVSTDTVVGHEPQKISRVVLFVFKTRWRHYLPYCRNKEALHGTYLREDCRTDNTWSPTSTFFSWVIFCRR